MIDIATELINTPADDLTATIDQAIARVGNCINADCGAILDYDTGRKTAQPRHQWRRQTVTAEQTPFPDDLYTEIAGWFEPGRNTLQVQLARTTELTPGPLRDKLEQNSVAGLLTLPMTVDEQARGLLFFATVNRKIEWQKTELTQLESFARMLVGARRRGRQERTLSRACEKQKETNKQLEDAVNRVQIMALEAESADLAKSQFLATMSHEIRTPMNAIIGLAHLVRNINQNPEIESYLDKIETSSNTLLQTINNILDYSKIEAGRMELSKDVFSPASTVREIVELFDFQAREKNLRLKYRIDNQLPDVLIGDSLRLHQILINLVSNALKFTEKGDVRIEVETTAREESTTSLCFSVIDSGIGISREQRKLLFRPFSQVDSSITRKQGGTGLGLSIIKHLINLMGGRIKLNSEPGKGSKFYFTVTFENMTAAEKEIYSLPARPEIEAPAPETTVPVSSAEPDQPPGKPENKASLLVVEDNETNREIAQALLEEAGFEITLANNGNEALPQLLEKCYDAVLMDLQMPELDGLETTRRIRAGQFNANDGETIDELSSSQNSLTADTPPWWATIPIIAVTAHAMEDDRERAIKAGMNDYITKPFEPENLINTVRKWIRKHDPTPIKIRQKAPIKDASELPVDFQDGLRRTDYNQFLYHRLLDQFQVDSANIIAGLERLIKTADWQSVKQKIHGLKGISGNIGAVELMNECKNIEENFAKGNLPLRQLRKLAEQLTAAEKEIDCWRQKHPPQVKTGTATAADKHIAGRNKKTILIVDDMPVNLTALKNVLTPEWHVETATDGENALRSAASEPMPDLILLDVKMPKMDGFEVCEKLKQETGTRHIPVIFITALNQEKDEARGLQLGAIDFISKPFSPPVIKARVRNHLLTQSLTEEFEKVFHGAQDAMFLVELTDNGEFRYIRSNQSHQQATGLQADAIQGATPQTLFGHEKGTEMESHYARCVAGRKTVSYQENLSLPTGDKIWLTRLTPVIESGKATYIVGSSTDITEQKKAEQAVTTAVRKERDFESRIEQMLLKSKLPGNIRGAELAAMSVPSRHTDGDFIDFYPFDRKIFDMVIGDVMGKGIQAALIGAGAKSLFLQIISRLIYKQARTNNAGNNMTTPPDPAQIVSLVNSELSRRLITLDRFISLCYVRIDLKEKMLYFVDCGHPGIIIRRAASGLCENLKGGNMPLGFQAKQEFQLHKTSLHAEDLIVFYSDGVSEARNKQGEMFGEQRLRKTIQQLPSAIEIEKIPRTLLAKVAAFTGQNSFADDFTCNVIRLDPDHSWQNRISIPGSIEDLAEVRRFSRSLLSTDTAKNWEDKKKYLFEVAVQEAVVNVIEHSFQGQQKKIDIEGTATPEWLRVRIEYEGEVYEFPPAAKMTPDRCGQNEKNTKDYGRGIHIMLSVMDECKSEQAEIGKACITLTKRLNK